MSNLPWNTRQDLSCLYELQYGDSNTVSCLYELQYGDSNTMSCLYELQYGDSNTMRSSECCIINCQSNLEMNSNNNTMTIFIKQLDYVHERY